MRVAYELSPDDLAALVDCHQQTSPAARRPRFGCFAAALAAMLALPLALFAPAYLRWRTRGLSPRQASEGQHAGCSGYCATAGSAGRIL